MEIFIVFKICEAIITGVVLKLNYVYIGIIDIEVLINVKNFVKWNIKVKIIQNSGFSVIILNFVVKKKV